MGRWYPPLRIHCPAGMRDALSTWSMIRDVGNRGTSARSRLNSFEPRNVFQNKTTFPSEPFSLRRGPDNIQLIRGGRSLPNVTHCTRSRTLHQQHHFFKTKVNSTPRQPPKTHAPDALALSLPHSLSSPSPLPSLSLPSVPPTPSPSPYVLLFGRFGLFRTISKIKLTFECFCVIFSVFSFFLASSFLLF